MIRSCYRQSLIPVISEPANGNQSNKGTGDTANINNFCHIKLRAFDWENNSKVIPRAQQGDAKEDEGVAVRGVIPAAPGSIRTGWLQVRVWFVSRNVCLEISVPVWSHCAPGC